jgi:hypothetical protein
VQVIHKELDLSRIHKVKQLSNNRLLDNNLSIHLFLDLHNHMRGNLEKTTKPADPSTLQPGFHLGGLEGSISLSLA